MRSFFSILLLAIFILEAKVAPQLTPSKARDKISEIMSSHASEKEMTPTIIKRAFVNFIEELDPNKTYFIESDIKEWLEPSDELVKRVMSEVKNSDYSEFQKIYNKMLSTIDRRDRLEKMIDVKNLPTKVDAKKFKDIAWAKEENELLTRLMEVRALQIEVAKKFDPDIKEKSLQRVEKMRLQYQEELETPDLIQREKFFLARVIKAFASALDSHTVYFTPEEAQQFLINVQQRLFGIGAALRDDISGFRVVKVVEGGPAERGGELKNDDLIIAVNGEPVVGMSINDVVAMVRGEENTSVVLTIIRDTKNDAGEVIHSDTKDVTVVRGEVVIKDQRYEVATHPFADGVIAYVKLFSFYQDPEHSSAADIEAEIEKIKQSEKVLGVILDLRSNSGGLLSQAVAVTGLFITKGVVVSVKDEKGEIQHLRDIDGRVVWNGPLIVMINRGSASASEIVAETLQDYGRALIVGDDHSFGKGSFQTFTLNATGNGQTEVNPEGEYKVTRGRYYTVSGKSPQLVGVLSDIQIPGPYSESDVGEKFSKFPLSTAEIPPMFDDDLSDLPLYQRARVASLYKVDLQQKLNTYQPYLATLKKNSEARQKQDKAYQAMLADLKKKDIDLEEELPQKGEQADFQLQEAYNLMKDLILLMGNKKSGIL